MSTPADITATKPAPEKAGEGVPKKTETAELSKEANDGTLKSEIALREKAINQPLSEAWKDVLTSVKHLLGNLRHHSIEKTPTFIVNNSPNIIGAMQLTAELAMFKSNGSNLLSSESKGKPFRYIVDPPINVFRSVTGRARPNIKLEDLIKPEFYRETAKSYTDLKVATAKDLQYGPLINRWQARATFAGIVGWGLNFITPNAKETTEQIEANVRLSIEHPVQYVFECFRKAIVFPVLTAKQAVQKIIPGINPSTDSNDQLGAYKRQFSGLGMMIAGACSFLGGWRNVARVKATGAENYYLNWQYCATGAITFMSSLPLLFSVDNDKGYSKFGLIHLGRCFFLPGSMLKKWNSGDKGTEWYMAGHGMLQSKNAFAALVGGAKKVTLPDGTVQIIDNSEVINKTKQEEIQIKQGKRQHHKDKNFDAMDSASPHTTISHATVERAMPERVADVARVKEAAAV